MGNFGGLNAQHMIKRECLEERSNVQWHDPSTASDIECTNARAIQKRHGLFVLVDSFVDSPLTILVGHLISQGVQCPCNSPLRLSNSPCLDW
jgi:hypothetical protein